MEKGRGNTDSFFVLLRRSPRTSLVLLFYLLVSSPALLSGCTSYDFPPGDGAPRSAAHNMSLVYAVGSVPVLKKIRLSIDVQTLDVFVYDFDGTGSLDTWEHFDDYDDKSVWIHCGSGDKLICLVANVDCSRWLLTQVQTADAIRRMELSLRDENPQSPAMTGWLPLEADVDEGDVVLEPLMARITLNSLSCDFTGTPYEGAPLDNVSIYLTNVSASAPLISSGESAATDFLNSGRLSEPDISSMKSPAMLLHTLPHPLGPEGMEGPLEFCCYPNETAMEMPGTAFTKLVVQGDIQGKTCYYPISINQQGYGYSCGSHGISRNVHYSVNLHLTRMGSDDPETPVACIDAEESGWIELHPGQFITAHSGQDVRIWCDIYPADAPFEISMEDLEYDKQRGIYDYTLDSDGHGVTLHCRQGGTGMFTIDAGYPVDEGFLIIVAVDP